MQQQRLRVPSTCSGLRLAPAFRSEQRATVDSHPRSSTDRRGGDSADAASSSYAGPCLVRRKNAATRSARQTEREGGVRRAENLQELTAKAVVQLLPLLMRRRPRHGFLIFISLDVIAHAGRALYLSLAYATHSTASFSLLRHIHMRSSLCRFKAAAAAAPRRRAPKRARGRFATSTFADARSTSTRGAAPIAAVRPHMKRH
jgi:hypothetical protein